MNQLSYPTNSSDCLLPVAPVLAEKGKNVAKQIKTKNCKIYKKNDAKLSGHWHPGFCEATPLKKRFGKYLEPQQFDDSDHSWNEALDKNWGTWSCCDCAANSPPCQERPSAQVKNK